jgi:hypothetical protein
VEFTCVIVLLKRFLIRKVFDCCYMHFIFNLPIHPPTHPSIHPSTHYLSNFLIINNFKNSNNFNYINNFINFAKYRNFNIFSNFNPFLILINLITFSFFYYLCQFLKQSPNKTLKQSKNWS